MVKKQLKQTAGTELALCFWVVRPSVCVCWSGGIPDRLTVGFYTVLQKSIAYHPTSTDNFNSSRQTFKKLF